MAVSRALSLAWPAQPADGLAALGPMAAELYGRVAGRIQIRVDNLSRQLEALDRAILAGQPLDRCWQGYDAVVLACEPLFEECLAVRQGVAARVQMLDGGICSIADHLLAELCADADLGWRRFTVLATGESYTHVSDVIRVRYPDLSVWDLPVVAHELGHHAALRLEQPTLGGFAVPFRRLSLAWRGRLAEALVEEHYADAFAAMTLGPCYASTCLLMRFEPVSREDGVMHPADRRRAAVILAVLRAAADAAGSERDRVLAQLDQLARLWQRFCRGTASEPEDATDDSLGELASDLYRLLRDALPLEARYREAVHVRVRALAERLLDADYEPGRDPDIRVAHALAAAWTARLDAGADAQMRGRVTANARRLLDALAPVPSTARE